MSPSSSLPSGKTLDEKPFEALVPWVHYVKAMAPPTTEPVLQVGRSGHRFATCDEGNGVGLRIVKQPPLRAYKRDAKGEVVKPVAIDRHPFPLTISTIQEAVKPRAADEALQQKGEESGPKREEEVNLWRGVKNMAVPKEFLLQGGVETGAMSTSRELEEPPL